MSASGSGRNTAGGAFTPLTFEDWMDVMRLADEATISNEAFGRLRLALVDLAPGWWVKLRAAEQADRVAARRQAAPNQDRPDPDRTP